MCAKAFGKDWKTRENVGCGQRRSSSRNLKLSVAYLVSIAARAERDLAQLYGEIHAQDSPAAQRWYRGLKHAILSLQKQPNRTPVTPENKRLRHLLYGSKAHVYRVIYRGIEKRRQVEVLHIQYGARRRFKFSDLE